MSEATIFESQGWRDLGFSFEPMPVAFEELAKKACGFSQALVELRSAEERRAARLKLGAGYALQDIYPSDGYDVQTVTTNEGRCRVVIRRLGGWQ